jgi:7,8-dihydropterin-6-yl-methyl-4-(beta-D-ribofuranosyl)aminobenzene 5'-phosphate synthase
MLFSGRLRTEETMDKYLGSQSPRRLMAAVGAGMGLGGGVFTNIETDVAPPLRSAPPEVDSLSVRVVTDSYHHQFEASGTFGDVRVQRYMLPPTNDPPRRTLQNEWGLALYLESTQGAETRRMLIDFGYTHETINNNIDMLGIDPATLDAMLLTHGHYDHFGGMVGFLQAHRRKLKPALPFYLGGEECFCARELGPVDAPRNFGALDRRAIAEGNLRVVFADKPSLVADHGFTTGWIPQVSFEQPAQPTRMKVGIGPDGMGCVTARLPEGKRNAAMIVDDFQHEHATCFHVKGKGLVVMTSCGHRGVVNTASGDQGVGYLQGPRGSRRLSPDADAGGVRAGDRARTRATAAGVADSDALQRRDLHRSGAAGDARKSAAFIDRNAIRVRGLSVPCFRFRTSGAEPCRQRSGILSPARLLTRFVVCSSGPYHAIALQRQLKPGGPR